MAFNSWRSYWSFSSKVRHGLRYIRDHKSEEFLQEVLASCESRITFIEEGSLLWRSQLGGSVRPIDPTNPDGGEELYPYSPERMIPQKHIAIEGRVNPKGIPHLYLATEKKTAMAECRPWVGSEISLAQFSVHKNLTLVDCSKYHSKNPLFFDVKKGFYEPPEIDRERAVWSHIDRSFSEPVSIKDDESNYAPTQIISELFRSAGYDGVIYKSMLGEGYNICLYDVNAANFISCQLYKTRNITFSFGLNSDVNRVS